MGDGQGFQRVGTILIQARASEASLSISGVRRGSWETQMQRTWEPVSPWPCMSPKDLTYSIVTKGASQVALVVKNLPAKAGDGKGRRWKRPEMEKARVQSLGRAHPWEEAWQPLQFSCLENSTDRGAWQATVHRVAESWT